jgi:hypothetical protein
MTIWDILWPFGTLCVHLVHFVRLRCHVPRKIWQPWLEGIKNGRSICHTIFGEEITEAIRFQRGYYNVGIKNGFTSTKIRSSKFFIDQKNRRDEDISDWKKIGEMKIFRIEKMDGFRSKPKTATNCFTAIAEIWRKDNFLKKIKWLEILWTKWSEKGSNGLLCLCT